MNNQSTNLSIQLQFLKDPTCMTLSDYAEQWLTIYAAKHLERTSYIRYEQVIHYNILPYLGDMSISEIKPYHLECFFSTLSEQDLRYDGHTGGYSHGTLCKIKTVLSSMFSTAVQWELIEHNPCSKIKLPKRTDIKSIKCYTAEQMKSFIEFLYDIYSCSNAMQYQYLVLHLIAIYGGLRRGELLGLTWEKVDYTTGTIYINQTINRVDGSYLIKSPKTKSSVRIVTLPLSVMNILRIYQIKQDNYRIQMADGWQGNNWLFIQKNGTNMSIGTPYAKFRQLIKLYNQQTNATIYLPELGLHSLRHTNASLLISSNLVDAQTVAHKLGHSNVTTTMKYYIHAYEENERKTAAVLEEVLHLPGSNI